MKFEHFVGLLLVVSSMAVFLSCAGCNPCKDEVFERNTSPDGKWIAITLMRDCGATTPPSVGVNVQRADEAHLKSENYVFAMEHVRELRVSWDGPGRVIIDCPACPPEEVRRKLERLGPIQIVYK